MGRRFKQFKFSERLSMPIPQGMKYIEKKSAAFINQSYLRKENTGKELPIGRQEHGTVRSGRIVNKTDAEFLVIHGIARAETGNMLGIVAKRLYLDVFCGVAPKY